MSWIDDIREKASKETKLIATEGGVENDQSAHFTAEEVNFLLAEIDILTAWIQRLRNER